MHTKQRKWGSSTITCPNGWFLAIGRRGKEIAERRSQSQRGEQMETMVNSCWTITEWSVRAKARCAECVPLPFVCVRSSARLPYYSRSQFLWNLTHIPAAAAAVASVRQSTLKPLAQESNFSRWNSFGRRGHNWAPVHEASIFVWVLLSLCVCLCVYVYLCLCVVYGHKAANTSEWKRKEKNKASCSSD